MVLRENMTMQEEDDWGLCCRTTNADDGCDAVLVTVAMYHEGWVTIPLSHGWSWSL